MEPDDFITTSVIFTIPDPPFSALKPCLVRKIFQDSPSHRIFSRMYRALNIDENKN